MGTLQNKYGETMNDKPLSIEIGKPAQASEKFKEITNEKRPKNEAGFVQANKCGEVETDEGTDIPSVSESGEEPQG